MTEAKFPIEQIFRTPEEREILARAASEQLNGKYKQAYEFAMNDHLQAKQDLDAAKQEIEELRVRLAETEAALKAMREHNDFLEDKLNIAIVDRTRAIDGCAEYAVRLDMLRKILEKPPATIND